VSSLRSLSLQWMLGNIQRDALTCLTQLEGLAVNGAALVSLPDIKNL